MGLTERAIQELKERAIQESTEELADDLATNVALSWEEDLFKRVAAEATRARGKFPEPRWLLMAMNEEVGELNKAVLQHICDGRSMESVRTELIQSMAMLLRLWTEGDPGIGLSPSRDSE